MIGIIIAIRIIIMAYKPVNLEVSVNEYTKLFLQSKLKTAKGGSIHGHRIFELVSKKQQISSLIQTGMQCSLTLPNQAKYKGIVDHINRKNGNMLLTILPKKALLGIKEAQ
jgi:hypothetical protein